MNERIEPLDLWAERRAELAELVARLTPAQALEVLRIVVAQCESNTHLGAVLAGTIKGMSERR